MARRQPSSVLSICMSRILDTSSVNTLKDRKATKSQSDHAPHLPLTSPTTGRPWGLREPRVALQVAWMGKAR